MKKSTKKEKLQRDYTTVRRGLFVVMFSGSIAISTYLSILVNEPDLGQLILAGFSTANAVYFFTKAIK